MADLLKEQCYEAGLDYTLIWGRNIGAFREKASGKVFAFGTTHLWWKSGDKTKMFSAGSAYQAYSDEAREYQIALLAEKIMDFRQKYDCPAVVVGDFNTDYNSKAVGYLFVNGFHHAHDIAVEYAEESIMLLGEREGSVKRFERYSPDYYFPISDHSPAYIDLEL